MLYVKTDEFVDIRMGHTYCKGVGEGGGDVPPPPLSKVGGGGGTSGFVPPPPLLGRANVLITRFAPIFWFKTQFFKIFLARFARHL